MNTVPDEILSEETGSTPDVNAVAAADGTEKPADGSTDGAVCSCTQCRIKSWAMWVSVLGLLGMLLQHLGVFAKLGLDTESWDMIITLIGSVLTAFGIVNNPTEKKKL